MCAYPLPYSVTVASRQVCAISNERLREPVAACELGYLYNKVRGLLVQSKKPPSPIFGVCFAG